ncbi:hypothetical protein M427DRAFT_66628 [Gonapodya prolifera JEL478]|uniref:RING-type domain-containing protein n=1 Tax=Gonapodya prolifera (strain JEL478) TaxID=1344416 RepID=A0A139ATF4_GONPJ|nr:hypothetical protein M427DRAFT_66628 [Gonapodya prolifera JEL478]|eukprot:KXS20011.1 hypothetical protein M427DRAFT_66628 [Gonapodya prolifera JEL478]
MAGAYISSNSFASTFPDYSSRDPSPPPYVPLHLDRNGAPPRGSSFHATNNGGPHIVAALDPEDAPADDEGAIAHVAEILGWPQSRVQVLARSINPASPEDVPAEALVDAAFANPALRGNPPPSPSFSTPAPDIRENISQLVNTRPQLPPRDEHATISSSAALNGAHAPPLPDLPSRPAPLQTTTTGTFSTATHGNSLAPPTPPRMPTRARSSSLSAAVEGARGSDSAFKDIAIAAVVTDPPSADDHHHPAHAPPPKAPKPLPGPHELTPDVCVVCMDNPKDAALVPCDHLAMCFECAEQLRTTVGVCAMCRQEIMMVVRIYRSFFLQPFKVFLVCFI